MPIIPVCDSSRFHVEGGASGPECGDASLRRVLCVECERCWGTGCAESSAPGGVFGVTLRRCVSAPRRFEESRCFSVAENEGTAIRRNVRTTQWPSLIFTTTNPFIPLQVYPENSYPLVPRPFSPRRIQNPVLLYAASLFVARFLCIRSHTSGEDIPRLKGVRTSSLDLWNSAVGPPFRAVWCRPQGQC